MTGLPPSTFTVLGASGYIGSRLVAHLQAQGHTVWAPTRGDTEVFTRPLGHVIYCVGLTADFRTRPFDTVDAHVGLLAEVLRRAQFDSLLYLSSTRVYMGAASTHEDAPLSVLPGDPSYLYNLTKLTGESLCHACGRPGVRVARLSNVVGPGMDSASGNLVADLLRQARQGHIVLRSDPQVEGPSHPCCRRGVVIFYDREGNRLWQTICTRYFSEPRNPQPSCKAFSKR